MADVSTSGSQTALEEGAISSSSSAAELSY